MPVREEKKRRQYYMKIKKKEDILVSLMISDFCSGREKQQKERESKKFSIVKSVIEKRVDSAKKENLF